MKRLTLDDLQAAAKSRGGRCLSENYLGSSQKIQWQCSKGHLWEAAARNIINSSSWCPYCAGRRHDIAEMISIANARGGKCTSEKYEGMQHKLSWVCAQGHKWKSTPANILIRGTWCPECSSGIGERICRSIISHLTGFSFPKARPLWLKSTRGTQLELDGYSEKLMVAFEHQGEQHYSPISHYSDQDMFSKRLLDDETKRMLCKKQGVVLVEIPEIGTRLPIGKAQEFIAKALAHHQIPLPGINADADLSSAYSSNGAADALYALGLQAASQGGEVIESQYCGSKSRYTFRCQYGHTWKTPAESVMRGRWCPYCSANKKSMRAKNSIEKIQSFAQAKEGKLLSKQYKSASDLLLWECKNGHQWSATFNSIRGGTWCPRCARWSIEELNDVARNRGGKIISSEFHRLSEPVEWECSFGHRWLARPGNVLNGTWCPHCHKIRIQNS